MTPSEAADRGPMRGYREQLRELGFRPSRRLGQNFLLEPALHRLLVESVAPTKDDLVLEVGAGLGFLTRELAGRCRVLAVEVDRRLHRILERELGPQQGVRIVAADALVRARLGPELTAALAEERAGCRGRLLLIANLPYAIAGPLLVATITMAAPPAAMALLVQQEFAARLAAVPGTKAYGALSALAQLACHVTVLRRVGAEVFWPRPKVDSSMVRLTARADGILGEPPAAREALARFLRQLFAARRKKLRNARVLAGDSDRLPAELLERRPDAVAPEELLELWRRVGDPGG